MKYKFKNSIILLYLLCIILIVFVTTLEENKIEKNKYIKIEPNKINCSLKYEENLIKRPIEMQKKEKEDKESKLNSNINEDDLYWLSQIVMQEMGGDWVSDELQQMVASVIINRVNSEYFPNTVKDVIFQKGQYAGVEYLSRVEPTDKVIENCKYILENGSILPNNVVFQAEFVQGDGVYYTYYDKYVGSTTYFCYKN